MRQGSSRNHRSKGGFRLKHLLQICLLLAICTWLVYQVKHSHDKKRQYEDRITTPSGKPAEKQKPSDLFELGRKALPLAGENNPAAAATRAKGEDGEEEEEAGDEEAKRDGEDAIDELDQERGDGENEQEEELAGEEDGKAGGEEDALFENEERDESSQEAREENYKRDDASSAVAHGTNSGEENGTNKNATFGANVIPANVSFAKNGSFSDSKSENWAISTVISTEESSRNRIEQLQHNITVEILPENDLGDSVAPALNVSGSSPEYQNSSKIQVEDRKSTWNEISTLVPNENEKKIEIYLQKSTVKEN